MSTDFRSLARDERLRGVRHGTAHFLRHVAELTDEQFDGASLLDGWTRRHVIAHVGYNAAALTRLLDWAATGTEHPMYASAAQRDAEIAQGATLSPGALRSLVQHTATRLDHAWRRMPESAWSAQVRTAQGRTVEAVETMWMRSREVWIHAVDLDTGARFADLPEPVLHTLLADVVGAWRSRGDGAGLVLRPDGSEPIAVGQSAPSGEVTGPLPAVVRWAVGRGAVGLAGEPDGPPPRWL
ncbi:maleylpyruvate isomerase family mycothiol-dependent enzyme [Tsukamurella pseudospumae]|uniref:Maleylpyruvate isomerase n=1 Tax=Tsukamurella pseudospumae TaxID=239498 RepID=A0A138AVL7_9ACTN|nr:maleylpyruvate isomerase family mycothiol-dependent enzyme [Tsukamurella pseudospumae]KXP14472.1 maleylpyruvate isomerase [Tsukamurella pseudospumae]